jgi:peroxiredoxin
MTTDVKPEIQVGDMAPDFTLKDQDQQDVRLSDYRGKKNVVLCFYPLDWSPVCQTENKCLTDDFPSFQSADAEVFGISCDSFFSHKAWAEALGLKHRLLSDIHRTVCKSYGLYYEPLNCAKRATVIVDKNGKVAYVKVQEIKTPRDDQEILAVLKTLK